MSVLSLTFHCPEPLLEKWEKYVDENLIQMTENLMDVDKFILSEVYSEMISEGKNYNLLLVFSDDELRSIFIENELENIAERVEKEFGKEIMLFQTFLNPKRSRF